MIGRVQYLLGLANTVEQKKVNQLSFSFMSRILLHRSGTSAAEASFDELESSVRESKSIST